MKKVYRFNTLHSFTRLTYYCFFIKTFYFVTIKKNKM